MSRLEAHQAAVLRKFRQWQWVETLVHCIARALYYNVEILFSCEYGLTIVVEKFVQLWHLGTLLAKR